MKTLSEYHGMQEEEIPVMRYFLVFIFSILLFILILSLKVDFNLSISLVKAGNEYGTYLSRHELDQIQSRGILFDGKSKYHYTFSIDEDANISYQNEIFYFVKFQFEEEVTKQILSGRIRISRSTIFERIFSLWKEES